MYTKFKIISLNIIYINYCLLHTILNHTPSQALLGKVIYINYFTNFD